MKAWSTALRITSLLQPWFLMFWCSCLTLFLNTSKIILLTTLGLVFKRVYVGVKTCEAFLCFVAIVKVSFYDVDFFVLHCTSLVSFTGSYAEDEPSKRSNFISCNIRVIIDVEIMTSGQLLCDKIPVVIYRCQEGKALLYWKCLNLNPRETCTSLQNAFDKGKKLLSWWFVTDIIFSNQVYIM